MPRTKTVSKNRNVVEAGLCGKAAKQAAMLRKKQEKPGVVPARARAALARSLSTGGLSKLATRISETLDEEARKVSSKTVEAKLGPKAELRDIQKPKLPPKQAPNRHFSEEVRAKAAEYRPQLPTPDFLDQPMTFAQCGIELAAGQVLRAMYHHRPEATVHMLEEALGSLPIAIALAARDGLLRTVSSSGMSRSTLASVLADITSGALGK